MKQSLKQWIWERLDNHESVCDQEVFNFTKKETSLYTAEEYKRQWRSFNFYKEKFKDLEENRNFTLEHHRRRYVVRDNEWEPNLYQPIPKDYYEYLNKKLNEE